MGQLLIDKPNEIELDRLTHKTAVGCAHIRPPETHNLSQSALFSVHSWCP